MTEHVDGAVKLVDTGIGQWMLNYSYSQLRNWELTGGDSLGHRSFKKVNEKDKGFNDKF